ncbi:MAG TPA: xanthine dehydrogenase family protein subunit M, partial [Aliiroseovarius sp.]|nr:xanthine dehydrogenase family protein subunit M [Aliiroseovarius sp.]
MQYLTPSTFDEASALALGATGATRFLAGGTDVLVQMHAGGATPDVLIDLKRIPGVYDITRTDDGWSIGVAVPGAVLCEHAALSAEWPGVVEAIDLIGSTQVQGRATPVGNLMNASPAADSVPALIAAGAEVSVLGADGSSRRMAVEDVPTGPGRTALAPGDVVTELHL